eukprot:gnl/Chilomastix_cuspidata/3248.p1 GENE.gnl/Chilomastix_cuspidata/3248~~gnl/Chilomastix_cuspidata/3248.p1  ORF type:complete len:650 (+),score=201.21 gnl/Chilomastix_cuspidata/3248:145-2094(+)
MGLLIKGGIWTNAEDEVLKAGIAKYGPNQWPRIASLLPRKTAKQCRARWYEYLSPRVKKREWTIEEEEKLLQSAESFPSQWRTIAQIVGRTSFQCHEHYQHLISEAQGRTDGDEDMTGEAAPEVLPARADPKDLDDSTREMISETKARIANVLGKKSKRRMRERQLEQSRRLATIQQNRELKASGMAPQMRRRRMKGIDYNTETFLKHAPAPGPFNASEEMRREKPLVGKNFRVMTVAEADGDSRTWAERVEDEKRTAKERLKQNAYQNALVTLAANSSADQKKARFIPRTGSLRLPPCSMSSTDNKKLLKLIRAESEIAELVRADEEADMMPTDVLVSEMGKSLSVAQMMMRGVRTPAASTSVMETARAHSVIVSRDSQAPSVGFEMPLPSEASVPSLFDEFQSFARGPGGATPLVKTCPRTRPVKELLATLPPVMHEPLRKRTPQISKSVHTVQGINSFPSSFEGRGLPLPSSTFVVHDDASPIEREILLEMQHILRNGTVPRRTARVQAASELIEREFITWLHKSGTDRSRLGEAMPERIAPESEGDEAARIALLGEAVREMGEQVETLRAEVHEDVSDFPVVASKALATLFDEVQRLQTQIASTKALASGEISQNSQEVAALEAAILELRAAEGDLQAEYAQLTK